MPTSRLTLNGDIGGITLNSTLTRTADGQIGHDVSLAAAVAGTVSSYSAGPPESWTLDLPTHALMVDDVVDVYWANGRRWGMKITAIAGDDVTVEDGLDSGGDLMLGTGTTVTVARQQTIDTDFQGDLLAAIGVLCSAIRHDILHFRGRVLATISSEYPDSSLASLNLRRVGSVWSCHGSSGRND